MSDPQLGGRRRKLLNADVACAIGNTAAFRLAVNSLIPLARQVDPDATAAIVVELYNSLYVTEGQPTNDGFNSNPTR